MCGLLAQYDSGEDNKGNILVCPICVRIHCDFL